MFLEGPLLVGLSIGTASQQSETPGYQCNEMWGLNVRESLSGSEAIVYKA